MKESDEIMKPDLSVTVCGVKFKNPMVVASATPSKDADYMKRCVDAGCGGIIAKTVSYEPLLQKYVSPRFTVLHKKGWPYCFSNYSCEFLAQHTPEEWGEELRATAAYCKSNGVALVGSISGGSLEQWDKLARMTERQVLTCWNSTLAVRTRETWDIRAGRNWAPIRMRRRSNQGGRCCR